MAPAGHPGEDAALYDTVRAVAMELCPALGISIPVGKDSMSMRTTWTDGGIEKAVTAPVSLIVSAFAPVPDVRRVLTPQLVMDAGETTLVWIDIFAGRLRLGGSALAQAYGQLGNVCPDVDDPMRLAAFFGAIQSLHRDGLLLAYHDIADGGLFTTLVEMAFASRSGLAIDLPPAEDALAMLFAEELGAVVQARSRDVAAIVRRLSDAGLALHAIGMQIGRASCRERV